LKQIARFDEIHLRPFEISQRQAVARVVGEFVAAVLAQEFLETLNRERKILLVVRLAGAVEQHFRRLVGIDLAGRRRDYEYHHEASKQPTKRRGKCLHPGVFLAGGWIKVDVGMTTITRRDLLVIRLDGLRRFWVPAHIV